MIKVAEAYPEEMFATVPQTLSWSHFIELVSIEDPVKRLFYQQMSVEGNWSIRILRQKEDSMLFERTAISAKPEGEILKTLQSVSNADIAPDLVFKNTYIFPPASSQCNTGYWLAGKRYFGIEVENF